MKFLLDTNAVIAILNENKSFIAKMKQYKPSDFAISSIVMFELFYGAYKSQQIEKNLSKIALLPFNILEFNQHDAEQAGKIRAYLANLGTPIGIYDVQIAGQAIERKYTLITHNVKEFSRIPHLIYEDWQN